MIPTYTKTIKLLSEHVDFRRNLRLSVLMRFFQEACIAHTEELGAGRAKTLDKGYLWVILKERILIEKLPRYDGTITLVCYPGPMLHYFFPRHLLVLDEKGEVLIRGNALWSLIDQKTREMIDPKEAGILVEGGEKGDEIAPILSLPIPPLSKSFEAKATYSLVDINGHLNNASYISLCLDACEENDIREKDMKEIFLSFKKEIPFGTSFRVDYDNVDGSYYFNDDYFSACLKMR